MQGNASSAPSLEQTVDSAMTANDDALTKLRLEIDKKTDVFDVVVVTVFSQNDVGYFLANHFGAELVLYFTGQTSLPFMNHAMGMPHNPAYMPLILFNFKPPLSFFQRLLNTFATTVLHYYGRYRMQFNLI